MGRIACLALAAAVLAFVPTSSRGEGPETYSFRIETAADGRVTVTGIEGTTWKGAAFSCPGRPCTGALNRLESQFMGPEGDRSRPFVGKEFLWNDRKGTTFRHYVCAAKTCKVSAPLPNGITHEMTLAFNENLSLEPTTTVTVEIQRYPDGVRPQPRPPELDRLAAGSMPVTMAFDDQSLSSVLDALGAAGSFKVTRSAGVVDLPVTLRFEKTTIGEILVALAQTGGLRYEVPSPDELVVRSAKDPT